MQKWLPGAPATEENMVKAQALESDYWDNHMHSVRVAIGKAWNGSV